jgi:hypothetical protein
MQRSLAAGFVGIALFLAQPLFAQSKAKAENVPEIPCESVPNFLKLPPDLYLGEGIGVATSSKGHVFVYTRSADTRMFEFDRNGVFVREIGQGLYGFEFAHSVRVDPEDNIWAVDEGTNMVIKFNPEGRVVMVLGRRPEAVEGLAAVAPGTAPPAPEPYVFNRPTDVGWDAAGNIFVTDGYGNSRIVKFDKNGRFLLSWGSRGSEPGQFNTPHSIATDAHGNVYVADQGNKRIQVFDNGGAFKSQIASIGVPTALCISSGAHQYLYSAHTGDPHGMDDAAIYKLELDGRIVGRFGKAGKLPNELGLVNALDCRNENEVFGELANWRVQKLILTPSASEPR